MKPKQMMSYSKITMKEEEIRQDIAMDELEADQIWVGASHGLELVGIDAIKNTVYDRVTGSFTVVFYTIGRCSGARRDESYVYIAGEGNYCCK